VRVSRRSRLRLSLLAAVALVGVTLPASAQSIGAEVVVRFDSKRTRVIHARGTADPATGRKVTADDPVRIASVSKLVVALGALRLTEDAVLDLDRDVSDYLGWKLRNPAFPDRAVSLRQLLSHRSSLVDRDDNYIVPLGETLQTRLSGPQAWDAEQPPGDFFRYANFNFPVIASVMEAATGERFDRLMDRLVIRPLGLDACFNWTTCSDAKLVHAVVLTDGAGNVLRDDIRGQRPACPVVPAADGGCDLSRYRPGENGALFSPQGGLRISMRDLAKVGQVFLNKGGGFLRPETIAQMIAPGPVLTAGTGAREDGLYCRFGFSVHILATRARGCRDDPFGDGKPRFGHSGEAYGLRSGLWLHGKRGVAFFVTAVPDDTPKGRSAFTNAEERVLRR
jgi:CubicO group peptidase (beta-lactamase class C family)